MAEAPVVRPGSNDALRPSAPFFANAGDGVRPDGVGCTGPGRVAVRGRAHLDVFADGRRVTVPGGIGVQPTCAYWLRTTRDDGIVAIESPQRRAFTLGDLFDIWGAPLSRTRVLAFPVGPDRPAPRLRERPPHHRRPAGDAHRGRPRDRARDRPTAVTDPVALPGRLTPAEP